MFTTEMNEAEVIEFLERRKGESASDYLTRTRDVYYKRAYERLDESSKILEQLQKAISKLIEKSDNKD